MSLDIYIDPQSGGYTLQDNKVVYVYTTINKVNILLSIPLGSYIYEPNVGNALLNKTGLVSSSEITEDVTNCLQPLLQNGELTSVSILSYILDPITQRYSLNLLLTLPNGSTPLITWIQ